MLSQLNLSNQNKTSWSFYNIISSTNVHINANTNIVIFTKILSDIFLVQSHLPYYNFIFVFIVLFTKIVKSGAATIINGNTMKRNTIKLSITPGNSSKISFLISK